MKYILAMLLAFPVMGSQRVQVDLCAFELTNGIDTALFFMKMARLSPRPSMRGFYQERAYRALLDTPYCYGKGNDRKKWEEWPERY